MRKRFLSFALVLTMVLSLALPAFAAVEPDIKAVMAGNGAKATLTVVVNGVESEPLVWSNNNTTVSELNGYAVSVAIKGNKINNVSWEKVAIGTDAVDIAEEQSSAVEAVVESGDHTNAAVIFTDPDIGGGGKTNGTEEETGLPKVIVPVNNAIFHCNTNGGNGRVWIDAWTADWEEAIADAAIQGLKKAVVGLEFTQASDDATRWILDTDAYICPECGRSDWISFSNKSGLPNGKNIQLQHLKLDPPVTPKWGLSINKLVDGKGIADWAFDFEGIELVDLIEQISFHIYPVSGNGAAIPEGSEPVAIGKLDFNGLVTFDIDRNDSPGWFAFKEVFVEDSWAEEYFVAPEIQYFLIDEVGGISKGSSVNWDDPEAESGFASMYAVAADDYDLKTAEIMAAEALKHPKNENTKVDLRANVDNALGAPDAIQAENDNSTFTGLGFFPGGITYYFGDDNVKHDIFNHPDDKVADLSLIEVTWTTNWHSEAVDVYLINAHVKDETDPDKTNVVSLLPVGTVKNRVKNDPGEYEDASGYGYKVKQSGSFTYTDIFLPNNIVKAEAIRLVDKTAEINSQILNPNPDTWYEYDDGYDLDAMVAYYTLPTNTFENTLDHDKLEPKGSVTFTKEVLFVGADEADTADADQFEFELYNIDGADETLVDTYSTGLGGMVSVSDLGPGEYVFKEVEQAGWELANYKDGLKFEINDKGETIWDYEGDQTEGNPVVLNIEWGALEVSAEVDAWHEEVTYEKEWEIVTVKDTLVSKGDMVAGVLGNSGQNFIAVDVNDAKSEVGVDVEIGLSDSKTTQGNTGFGVYYNVKVVDDQVIVSVKDSAIISFDVGIQSFASLEEAANRKPGKPGGNGENFAVGIIDNVEVFSLSVPLMDNDVVYLYVHASSMDYYTGNFEWVQKGEPVVVVDTYEGSLTLTVKQQGSEEVSMVEEISLTDNHGKITITNLETGVYSLTLSGAGFDDITIDDVEVKAGETTVVAFDPITVHGELVEIYLED